MIITILIISPAIMAASNTAIMAMTAIIIGRAMISSAIIIGTAIMAASNAAIMAVIIICLLDDAGRFDVGRMDHAGKR